MLKFFLKDWDLVAVTLIEARDSTVWDNSYRKRTELAIEQGFTVLKDTVTEEGAQGCGGYSLVKGVNMTQRITLTKM